MLRTGLVGVHANKESAQHRIGVLSKCFLPSFHKFSISYFTLSVDRLRRYGGQEITPSLWGSRRALERV